MRPTLMFLAALSLAMGGARCANSNFAGNAAKGGASSKDKKDDGGDGNDAPDSANVDENGKEGNGGVESGTDGKLGNPGGTDSNGTPGIEGEGDVENGGVEGSDSAIDDGTGLLITDDGFGCTKKLLPLRIAFAIDATGSMDEELAAVKDNVVQFAAKIKEIQPKGSKTKIVDVKFSAVTYVDQPGDNHVIPWGDAAGFQGALAGEDTRGGINDHCEGGLNGAKAALEMLDSEIAGLPDGGVPILIVISDNYSHDGLGASGARNFDSGPLQALLKKKTFKHALLFDSVPTSSDVPKFTACPTAPMGAAPTAQWVDVRKAWKDAHPKAKFDAGKNVTFPFSQATIINDLPAELARMLRVCE